MDGIIVSPVSAPTEDENGISHTLSSYMAVLQSDAGSGVLSSYDADMAETYDFCLATLMLKATWTHPMCAFGIKGQTGTSYKIPNSNGASWSVFWMPGFFMVMNGLGAAYDWCYVQFFK